MERHLARRLDQLVVRYYFVDEAIIQRLLCGKFLIHVPDFLGAPLANDVLKEPGSVACIERANHRADLTEDCAFLGNGEVTTHLKDIAAADSKTVNAGNHGLLKALDSVVHLQGWQHAIKPEERRVGKEGVST